jgi:hypothetical protein
MRPGCPLSPHLFNIVLKFLARTIKKVGRKNKRNTIGLVEVKLYLFVEDMILHLKDLKNFTKTS